jgi:hypothetical protein
MSNKHVRKQALHLFDYWVSDFLRGQHIFFRRLTTFFPTLFFQIFFGMGAGVGVRVLGRVLFLVVSFFCWPAMCGYALEASSTRTHAVVMVV